MNVRKWTRSDPQRSIDDEIRHLESNIQRWAGDESMSLTVASNRKTLHWMRSRKAAGDHLEPEEIQDGN